MIVQSFSRRQEGKQNIVFTCPDRDAPHAKRQSWHSPQWTRSKSTKACHIKRDVAKVSVIGVGMKFPCGRRASTMFSALVRQGHQHPGHLDLGDQDLRPDRCSQYTELAVRALHTAYGLDSD
jgi:aspartate kinase